MKIFMNMEIEPFSERHSDFHSDLAPSARGRPQSKQTPYLQNVVFSSRTGVPTVAPVQPSFSRIRHNVIDGQIFLKFGTNIYDGVYIHTKKINLRLVIKKFSFKTI